MAAEIHKGDKGTKFLVTIKDGTSAVNISDATTKQIYFQKPGGTDVANTASFETTGVDGKINYVVSSSSEINEIGVWKIQARIVTPSGAWKSEVKEFTVYDNIQ